MTDEQTDAIPEAAAKTPAPVPWYSLNPKHLRFSKYTWYFLAVTGVVLLVNFFSVKPLWQWGWRTRLYCFSEFSATRSARGATHPGGAWLASRRIVVYGAPGVEPNTVAVAVKGLREVINELGLAISIERSPLTADAKESITACIGKDENGGPTFDADRFDKLRLDDRGDRYGETVVLHEMDFRNPSWAWGLTSFNTGVAVLRDDVPAFYDLARHEGTHLLGYDKHDDMPFYVFGYTEDWNPQARDTLMMLLPKTSSDLSPRAYDALINFYRGMEQRTGIRFFR